MQRGQTHSPETKAKMSAARKGRVMSPEWKAKISAGKKAAFAARKAAESKNG